MARSSQGLAELAGIIGWPAAMLLVMSVGGQSRRIPHNAHPDHWLTYLIGGDAAAKLCAMYGGDILAVPKNESGVLAERNKAIRADRNPASGVPMTINALASKYRLTDRQIYNVLGQVEDD